MIHCVMQRGVRLREYNRYVAPDGILKAAVNVYARLRSRYKTCERTLAASYLVRNSKVDTSTKTCPD